MLCMAVSSFLPVPRLGLVNPEGYIAFSLFPHLSAIPQTLQVSKPIPSIVRLIRLEECYAFVPDAFEVGVQPSHEILVRLFNRELNIATDRARILLGDGACYVVEDAPKTVRALANPDSYIDCDAVKGLHGGINLRIVGHDTTVRMPNECFQPRQVFATTTYHGVDFIKFLDHGANL
jgi:hypothetical protein